jgi:hypothetical protein
MSHYLNVFHKVHSHLNRAQTVMKASYPMGSGGPFPGGKAQLGCDADHSPPSSAEVKYE